MPPPLVVSRLASHRLGHQYAIVPHFLLRRYELSAADLTSPAGEIVRVMASTKLRQAHMRVRMHAHMHAHTLAHAHARMQGHASAAMYWLIQVCMRACVRAPVRAC